MSSALTARQWVTVVLVNVVVSAVTTLIVVRVLMNPSAPRPTAVALVPAVTSTPQQASSADDTSVTATPADDAASAQTTLTPARPTSAPASLTRTPARANVTATSISTGISTGTSAGTATASASTGKVRIGRVLFPGQRQRETVVIANDSDADVLLKGWVLSSNRNVSYTFGNVTLFRNNFINLHTTSGTDVPTDLFWNKVDPAWQVGDVLTLTNNGQVMATYTVSH